MLTHQEQTLIDNVMRRATIRDIARSICLQKGKSVASVLGPSRKPEDCRIREIICYIAREKGFSYPQIGRAIGRHHTSVLHAVANERKRRAEQGFAEDQTMPYNEQRPGE